MNNNIDKAIKFAKYYHGGQVRKYTGEPYFVHCEEVATIVAQHGGSDTQIIAAYLHDTVEDTGAELSIIEYEFGTEVAILVEMLTDVSKPSDGNRRRRKEIDREHTARSSPEAKTIKLADLISNTKSIITGDKNFAKVYLREKEQLLPYLEEGNKELFNKANELLILGFLTFLEEK